MATRTTDQQAALDTGQIRFVIRRVDVYLRALARWEKSRGPDRPDFDEWEELVVIASALHHQLERFQVAPRCKSVMVEVCLEALARHSALSFLLEGLKSVAGGGAMIGQDIENQRRSLEIVRESLEGLAVWTTRQERGPEGPDPLDEPSIPTREVIREVVLEQMQAEKAAVPLDHTTEEALDIVKENSRRVGALWRGIIGRKIITALAERDITYELRSFNRHIVPKLKLHGVKNDRKGAGYYLPS